MDLPGSSSHHAINSCTVLAIRFVQHLWNSCSRFLSTTPSSSRIHGENLDILSCFQSPTPPHLSLSSGVFPEEVQTSSCWAVKFQHNICSIKASLDPFDDLMIFQSFQAFQIEAVAGEGETCLLLHNKLLPQACFKNVKGFLRCCLVNWPYLLLHRHIGVDAFQLMRVQHSHWAKLILTNHWVIHPKHISIKFHPLGPILIICRHQGILLSHQFLDSQMHHLQELDHAEEMGQTVKQWKSFIFILVQICWLKGRKSTMNVAGLRSICWKCWNKMKMVTPVTALKQILHKVWKRNNDVAFHPSKSTIVYPCMCSGRYINNVWWKWMNIYMNSR